MISRIGVVGAGFMGSGIAESAAAAGVQVTIFEPEQAPLDRSLRRLRQSVDGAVTRGKMTGEDAEALTDGLHFFSPVPVMKLVEVVKRPEYAPPPLLKRMVVSGHHGRKAGRGFYEYPEVAAPAGVAA